MIESVDDLSKSLAVLFVLIALIPSITFRIGFELRHELKERKLTLHENATWFLIPSVLSFLIFNGLFLNLPYIESFRMRTDALVHLEFFFPSSRLRHFVAWYLVFLILNALAGFLIACLMEKAKQLQSKKQIGKLGTRVRDQSWEDLFELIYEKNQDKNIYVKSKDGDIYCGFLTHYSFDQNNQLELFVLKNAKRKIGKKQDENIEFYEVSLITGHLVILATDIANIWLKPDLKLATETAMTKTEINEYIKEIYPSSTK